MTRFANMHTMQSIRVWHWRRSGLSLPYLPLGA